MRETENVLADYPFGKKKSTETASHNEELVQPMF